LSWHRLTGPFFGNALTTVAFGDQGGELVMERARRAGGGSRLEQVSRIQLAS
jgi:hypothetical protein